MKRMTNSNNLDGATMKEWVMFMLILMILLVLIVAPVIQELPTPPDRRPIESYCFDLIGSYFPDGYSYTKPEVINTNYDVSDCQCVYSCAITVMDIDMDTYQFLFTAVCTYRNKFECNFYAFFFVSPRVSIDEIDVIHYKIIY